MITNQQQLSAGAGEAHDDPAGVALRDPEPIDERDNCSPTTVRG